MWQAIDRLDFERIKAKLLHRKDNHWTPATIERAERGYRQFLKLSGKYTGVAVVPNEEVDQFWHAHILDTQRYASDCERIFGYVLHHNPYVGIDGPEDEACLQRLAAETRELAAREFGSASAESAAYCAVQSTGAVVPAYCAVPSGASAAAAYCAIASDKSAQPAYCAVSATMQARSPAPTQGPRIRPDSR